VAAETRTVIAPRDRLQIVGTVAYMSPEQAGQSIDARSDLFAGTAEMLTDAALRRRDIATLAAILHRSGPRITSPRERIVLRAPQIATTPDCLGSLALDLQSDRA
jgi:hypothetical protein